MVTLPAPFDSADVSAGLSWSRRVVTMTLRQPGQLHRCRYDIAWIELRESAPWRGEPHVHATRRDAPNAPRIAFTPTATKHVARDLLPVVVGDTFDRWWTSLHQARHSADPHRECAARARRIVEWLDLRIELADAYGRGHIALRPLSDDDRPRTQLIVDGTGRLVREELLAEASISRSHVGWLTRTGELIPDEDVLNGEPFARRGSG